ncbi:MAG: NAD(P)/FAD-dependent oxidoreductase [Pseudomonadota bacterium]
MEVEYAVIGGSYAGMSAALQLARARRSVAVVDAGLRRNRFAAESHGFLAQDGKPPGEIAEEARRQLLKYPNVRWIEGQAQTARRLDDEHLEVQWGGQSLQARRLILATGVVDELPEVQGLAERWGRSVFHCPYCHGYELGGGAIGVLAASALAQHHALMLPDWGTVTLFLNGNYTPDAEQRAALQRRGVEIEAVPVARLSGHADVVLADGRVRSMTGLFTQARTRMASTLAEQLGCAFEEGPTGPYIRTDGMQQTSVPGVFACGDAARAAGNVAISVGEGAMAGAAAHRSLLF